MLKRVQHDNCGDEGAHKLRHAEFISASLCNYEEIPKRVRDDRCRELDDLIENAIPNMFY